MLCKKINSHLLLMLGLGCIIAIGCNRKIDMPNLDTPTTNIQILGLGDSYTIGESVDTNSRYLMILAELLQNKKYKIDAPTIIAKTGWTCNELLQSPQLKSDTLKYDFVFLLIGVNDEYRGYEPDSYKQSFQKCIEKAISKSKNGPTSVFVLSIPDYSVTSFAGSQSLPNSISTRIDLFNQINQYFASQYQTNYVEITEGSRDALTKTELIASDGLHPSREMYQNWATKILPLLESKL
jgi:lysophospholipase L1-like esterase